MSEPKVLNHCPLCGANLKYMEIRQCVEVYKFTSRGYIKANLMRESIDSVNTNYLLCCNDECDFLAENLMVRNHPEIKVFKERGTFYYTVEDKE